MNKIKYHHILGYKSLLYRLSAKYAQKKGFWSPGILKIWDVLLTNAPLNWPHGSWSNAGNREPLLSYH
jgi:hypothetical protein